MNFNITVAESKIFYDAMDEAIEHFGVQLIYIRAENKNRDAILGEYLQQEYKSENVYEVYGRFESLAAFEGELDLYSKFGIQTQENMHINISSKTFNDLGFQPMQNDIIFWKDGQCAFEVTFVSREVDDTAFYMGGKPNAIVWRITTHKYVYDNDKFSTGVSALDSDVIESVTETDNERIDDINDVINNILDSDERAPWDK